MTYSSMGTSSAAWGVAFSKSGDALDWYAELLECAPPWPAPFSQEAHRFDTLEAAIAWVGRPSVENGV